MKNSDYGLAGKKLASIERISADANYSFIHLENGRKELHAYTLARYHECLPSFIRIHRQHLINPRFVMAIEGSVGGSSLLLLSGQRLPIARRRHKEVVKLLTA